MIKRLLNKLMGKKVVTELNPETTKTLSDTIKYNDSVPEGHIGNSHIPDEVFESELFIYNCGRNKKNPNNFTVLIKPMKQKG